VLDPNSYPVGVFFNRKCQKNSIKKGKKKMEKNITRKIIKLNKKINEGEKGKR